MAQNETAEDPGLMFGHIGPQDRCPTDVINYYIILNLGHFDLFIQFQKKKSSQDTQNTG